MNSLDSGANGGFWPRGATPDRTLLIGTYTDSLWFVDGHADGIFCGPIGRENDGVLTACQTLLQCSNPSWIALNLTGDRLYAVDETTSFQGLDSGGVRAYRRDLGSGHLELISAVPSHGRQPCHLAVDPTHTWVVATNFAGSSVVIWKIDVDGGVREQTDMVTHEGSGPHPIRQATPHPHQACFDPVNGDLLIPDMGLDKIFVYRISVAGELLEAADRAIGLSPGAGPRHIAFSPDGRHLFVLNEIGSTLVCLRRESAAFVVADVISTVPAGFIVENSPAAITVTSDGRHVFASNRGHDSVLGVAFDQDTSRFRSPAWTPSGGRVPRAFCLSDDDRYLYVANQDTDSIVTFELSTDRRDLLAVGRCAAPTPVCLVVA